MTHLLPQINLFQGELDHFYLYIYYNTGGQKMEIKERLANIQYKRLYIESLKATLEHDRELIKLFPKYLAELEKEDLKQIEQAEADLQADIDLINNLDNELQRKALIERYYNGFSWDKVADTLGYSRKYLYKIHKQALEQLASMFLWQWKIVRAIM